MKDQLIVVDCQYDFITGSLACLNAIDAIDWIIKYINHNDVEVFYSMDWHNKTNKSFVENGGIWPPHCVKNTKGSKLHKDFYEKILDNRNKPNVENMYYKGKDDFVEEYSVYNALNERGETLSTNINEKVIITGIASEFCVRESVLEFLNDKKEVYIISQALGYVKEEEHKKNLQELLILGAKLI